MAPGFYTTRQSPCVNLSTDIPGKQDELAGIRSDANSNEALISPEAPTSPFVLPAAKNLFTKFMKVFMQTTQVQAKPQKRPLKARTSEIYWGKSHMKCDHFCQ